MTDHIDDGLYIFEHVCEDTEGLTGFSHWFMSKIFARNRSRLICGHKTKKPGG